MFYQEKYLKYKNKYLNLKKQIGGKYKWRYTDNADEIPLEIQTLIEKEYQIWITLGKPYNYSNQNISFPDYTYNKRNIIRSSDFIVSSTKTAQASDATVDEECSCCELRLASYPENWKHLAYVPPGKIYPAFRGFEDFGDKESRFIDAFNRSGGCIKCIARAKELLEKKASEEAARIIFNKRFEPPKK
jgi:hypothetical protein